jgi:hypothetical protein
MGVRIRGLDIKPGAANLKADRAARLEAGLVIDRWRRLATGRDMLWSPTIRAALIGGNTVAGRLLELRDADSGDCGQVFRLIADSDSDRSRTAFR